MPRKQKSQRNTFYNLNLISTISGIFLGIFITISYQYLFNSSTTPILPPSIAKYNTIKGQLSACETHLHQARATLINKNV